MSEKPSENVYNSVRELTNERSINLKELSAGVKVLEDRHTQPEVCF